MNSQSFILRCLEIVCFYLNTMQNAEHSFLHANNYQAYSRKDGEERYTRSTE
jgi:hypothetical protein